MVLGSIRLQYGLGIKNEKFREKARRAILERGRYFTPQASLARGLGKRSHMQGILYARCRSRGKEEMVGMVSECRSLEDNAQCEELFKYNELQGTLLHGLLEGFWGR